MRFDCWEWVQWIRTSRLTMLIQLHKTGPARGMLLSHMTDTFKSSVLWTDDLKVHSTLILLLM